MARQVIWTPLAQQKRKEILKFWIEKTQSKTYSTKLNNLFKESTKLLSNHPDIGRRTDMHGVRVKIVRDYLLFYEVSDSTISILTVWDSRQDPDDLKIR